MPKAPAILLAGQGSGPLRQAVADSLNQRGWQVNTAWSDEMDKMPAASLVFAVTDGIPTESDARIVRVAYQQGIPSLRLFVEPGRAVLGPCALPGEPGCVSCAETRRTRAREHPKEHVETERRFAPRLVSPQHSWLTSISAAVLAEIALAEVMTMLESGRQPITLRTLYILRLDTLEGTLHPFLPDPQCQECGGLPSDQSAAASIAIGSHRICAPRGYRVRQLDDDVLRTYVDAETGIIRGVARDGASIFPNASARIGLPGSHRTEIGFGRTLSYRQSELTAVTEALERYAGIRPGGRCPAVRGSYTRLASETLHPPELGLHADWQYALPGFRFQRYRDDLVLDWVWGYSFGRQAPILVPETYAYYGQAHRDRPFVYEISNGCALGGSLEEAILYGLIEVAERDAFLLAWYTRVARGRIDLQTVRDRNVLLMVDRIEDVTGYQVHAFDITTEHDIPAFWVMAVDQWHDDRPKMRIAAGAHLEREKALASALLELAPLVSREPGAYRAERPRALAMLSDPFRVRNMDDHAIAYCVPEAFDRLSFLYQAPCRGLDESITGTQRNPDIALILFQIIHQYLNSGLDVIVIDQTTPEHETGGFRCVKVIVPGALPMTFGYQHTRITGLSRLPETGLNPHPHPFP